MGFESRREKLFYEFEKHFTVADDKASLQLLESIRNDLSSQIQSVNSHVQTLYQAGQDDVDGKLHKDIKDIDDVNTTGEVNEELWEELVRVRDALFNWRPATKRGAQKKIREVIGDRDISRNISEAAMIEIYYDLYRIAHGNDMEGFMTNPKEF